MKRREFTKIVTYVDRLQAAERDKLTLTASNHLDRMHAQLPALYLTENRPQSVTLISDPAMSKVRLDELQIHITSITEEIQLEKFEFIDIDDNDKSISSI